MENKKRTVQNGIKEEKKLEFSLPLNKRFIKYAFLIIAFTALMYWVVANPQKLFGLMSAVLSLLTPFIVGACIAYVVNLLLIPAERLWNIIWQKSKARAVAKARRPVCLVLSSLIVFGAVFAVLFMIIPEIKNTVETLISRVPQYISTLDTWYAGLSEFFAKYNFELPNIKIEADKVGNLINSFITSYGNSFVNTTVTVTTSIVAVVVDIVLGVVFSIYILSQKENLIRQSRNVLYALTNKERADKVISITSLTNRIFTKFVTGQFTEAVIIGILCFIGMLIFRMPYAAVISVLVGFTALIPVFGAFFGTGVGAFLILLENPQKALWFVLFIIILQQLEGNLIYPKVVGKSVGLPGIWVLVAVTIGGSALGVTGMLFAVPVVTVIYVLFKEYIAKRLKEKDIHRNQIKMEL